jgi:hypothetical protein
MSPSFGLQPQRKHQKMEMIPGSSTVEHSAVNRRVASSNLARGAKLFGLKQLQSVGRAFGSRPNAWACEAKSPLRKLLNQKLFSNRPSKINKRCHKNVIVLSDSGAAQSSLLVHLG